MHLFYGSQSKKITQSIAKGLNISPASYDLVRFGDSEIKPVIKENVRGETCIVIASTSPPVNESYMEFFLLVDALRRSSAEKIIAVIPYFGYARQNQQHLPGEPVSAHVMVKFIEAVGVDELITIDLHEEQLTGFFEIPVAHLSALPLLADKIASDLLHRHSNSSCHSRESGNPHNIIVVSPDQGGVERTRKFRDALAKHFNKHHLKQPTRHSEQLTRHSELDSESNFIDSGSESGITLEVSEETALVEKKRNLYHTHETKVMELIGDIKDKVVIIPDDVIVSGGTIVNAVNAVKKAGATSVYLCAAHADFIDGTVEKLSNAPVEKVIVTDTIEVKDERKFEKLETISVVDLIVKEIEKFN